MANKKTKSVKKKFPSVGKAFIKATFNNTIITITDLQGNVLAWSSAPTVGFKGSRKGTPFAAQQAALDVSGRARSYGMTTLAEVHVKGPGPGRESAVRFLAAAQVEDDDSGRGKGGSTGGLVIQMIKDVTPIAHNGVRPPKRRRV